MNATDVLPVEPAVALSDEAAAEDELVRRIQLGERNAFSELVGLFQKRVFVQAFAFFRNRDDALEIVQETFMRDP